MVNGELQEFEVTPALPEFVDSFNKLSEDIHEWAVRKGFWEQNPISMTNEQLSSKISLIHCELAEATEGLRHHNPPDEHIPQFSSVEVELADAIIRIMDLSVAMRLRLAEAIVAKMKFNGTRPYKHGKAF